MIHRGLVHEILCDRQTGSFLYPYYGKYSLAELTQSLLGLFGVDTGRPTLPFPLVTGNPVKHALLFFIDGLGWNHFTEQADFQPFFGHLRDRADVYPLTTVFPATTPAALTTFHTGLTPEEHGLPEWTVYFEEIDQLVETLPFRQHLTHGRDTLLENGGKDEMLYSGTTLYQQLADVGAKPYVFIFEDYADSAYARATQRGATIVPFHDAEELFAKLVKHLIDATERSYFFVYWSEVDSTEHTFGPGSPEHYAALSHLSLMFEELFFSRLPSEMGDDILFLLTSDHGQSAIRNEDIIYLNEYVDLERNYAKSASGKPIYPSGSPHDVFLFIDPPYVDAAVSLLSRELAGKALVLSTEEALRRNLFGFTTATDRFRRRIGNVLILPYEGYHVWYRHMPQMYFGQRGIHGGLARDEMLVPLVTARLSDLLR
ncbi:MAG: alkaline phosphatase family protein [Bacillota bacterium]